MKNSLRGYDKFQALRENEIRPKDLGMFGRTGDVNRLNARVRVAKSFESMELSDYGTATAQAYSSILRVFLTYSALEVMANLFDLPPFRFRREFPDHPYDQVAITIRNCDPDWKFTTALIEHIEREELRESLRRFINGNKNNPIDFATAIRHIFAHGHLTAHKAGTDPGHVRMICDALAELLIELMDTEFDNKVEPMYRDYLNKGVIVID